MVGEGVYILASASGGEVSSTLVAVNRRKVKRFSSEIGVLSANRRVSVRLITEVIAIYSEDEFRQTKRG